jgi:hypothetical protein
MATQIIQVDAQRKLLVLDQVTIVAPLGLRFRDAVTGALVGDGFSVWAYPSIQPYARRPLIPNRKGVYVLHHAPGLRDLENGKGDDAFWSNLSASREFVVEVRDLEDRFLPFQFTAALPARGIFQWNDSTGGSPPTSIASLPVYSSCTRIPPAGIAVVRADLWDPSRNGHGAGAASAVIELYDDQQLVARGIADQQGRIAILFPYPSPRSFSPASPPGSAFGSPPVATGPPLTEQIWMLRVRAFYARADQSLSISKDKDALPDLRSILSQPEAVLWADESRTEPLQETAVQYGQSLILKSRPSSMSPPATTQGSVLFITPAGSPP